MHPDTEILPDSYDFPQLLALPVGKCAEVPEYFGPVDVANVAGKGRGLVVVRPVTAGELLFANRAFATASLDALPETTTKKLECCSQEQFDAFFMLCDGKSTPSDMPRLVSSKDEKQESKLRRVVDRDRVKAILAANAHELDTSDLSQSRPLSHSVSALFLVGSLVNHSCRPTAARVFLGDMMFVRAARDMNSGEEITDGYISVLQPSFDRREKLLKRHGFGISDDRALVEDKLLPERQARRLVERMDEAETFEDFAQLTRDVETFVNDRLHWLGSGFATAEVEAAATRLGPGLQQLLVGGMATAAYVAVAALLARQDKHAAAAMAYSKCCWLLEELAPHNAYHASWAVEALLEAANGGLPLDVYIRYARKVLNAHCGPGTLEEAIRARATSSRLRPTLLRDTLGTMAWPPGEACVACAQKDQMLEVRLEASQVLLPQDLEVTASPLVLQLKLGKKQLSVMLPRRVQHGIAGAVRLSKCGKKVRICFPLA